MSRWRKRKRVLAGELGPVGADQLVPDERREAWQHLRLVGGERLDGAAVEDLALDRPALEHERSGGSSRSRRAARSALQRRRHVEHARRRPPSPASR